MVIYDLCCDLGHGFEGWFDSAEAFAEQLEAGQLSCPSCGSTAILKRPHATAHLARRSERWSAPPPAQQLQQQLRAAMIQLAATVRAHSVDVGPAFAGEARRMHRGETEAQMIRGTATAEEEQALAEEGVPFVKVPMPKPDA